MKNLCEEYVLTHTVEEALQALSAAYGAARIVSGGSDLLLDIQQGNCPPVKTLVDVTEIDEMCGLEIRHESLFIGASLSLTRLANSSLVKQHAQALVEAASLMANPQVCNVATIGGNVAHALPAADGTISLLALDAQAEVANTNGRRRVPLNKLFKGPGESTLDSNQELLVGFYLPLHETGQASAFVRRVSPQGIPLAILNMAVWLHRKQGRVLNVRIAVGPSGPVPIRMVSAEGVLMGQILSPEVQAHALEALRKEAHFRSSLHRASAEYRRHLVEVLLQEALDKAWQRAG
jgi:carbon-monoxide dehydrogenase medium subunit